MVGVYPPATPGVYWLPAAAFLITTLCLTEEGPPVYSTPPFLGAGATKLDLLIANGGAMILRIIFFAGLPILSYFYTESMMAA